MCIFEHTIYLNTWQTIVQCLLKEIEAKQLLLEIGLHSKSIHERTLDCVSMLNI